MLVTSPPFKLIFYMRSPQDEFKFILDYPYAKVFLLLLYHCCDNKIMYLQRSLGQHILLYAQCCDHKIETTLAQYNDANFAAGGPNKLAEIPSDVDPLTLDHRIQLAKVQ